MSKRKLREMEQVTGMDDLKENVALAVQTCNRYTCDKESHLLAADRGPSLSLVQLSGNRHTQPQAVGNRTSSNDILHINNLNEADRGGSDRVVGSMLGLDGMPNLPIFYIWT